jgi:hypothetical protein
MGQGCQWLITNTETVRNYSRPIKRKIHGPGFILVGDELRRALTLAGGQEGPEEVLTGVQRGQRGGQTTEATSASRGRVAAAPEVDEFDGFVFRVSGELWW